MTYREFKSRFPDESSCIEFISTHKFAGRKMYPYKRVGRKCFYINRHQVSMMSDTVFKKSSTDLTKWFEVAWMYSNGNPSINSVYRTIGVTYKCTWRMCNLIKPFSVKDGKKVSLVDILRAAIRVC